MDPMAEKYYSVSPYAFCSGNPVNFVDWDGRDAIVNIDRELKTMNISVNIYIYGKEASDELAQKYKESILDTWGNIKDVESEEGIYTITWNVNVTNIGDENAEFDFSDGKSNYFLIDSGAATSSVRNSHEGTLRPIVGIHNDMIHEFGHLLGLSDKYGTDKTDKKTYRKPIVGYEGNVMAEEAGMGVVEPMNIKTALYPVFNAKSNRNVYYLNRYNSERKRNLQ